MLFFFRPRTFSSPKANLWEKRSHIFQNQLEILSIICNSKTVNDESNVKTTAGRQGRRESEHAQQVVQTVSAGTGSTGASTPCQDAAASGGEVHRREALHRCVNFISLYLALSPVNPPELTNGLAGCRNFASSMKHIGRSREVPCAQWQISLFVSHPSTQQS